MKKFLLGVVAGLVTAKILRSEKVSPYVEKGKTAVQDAVNRIKKDDATETASVEEAKTE